MRKLQVSSADGPLLPAGTQYLRQSFPAVAESAARRESATAERVAD